MLVAVSTFSYRDPYRGDEHCLAGVTHVAEESYLAKAYPHAFKKASFRDQTIRSGECMRIYSGPDAVMVGKMPPTARTTTRKPARKPRVHFDQRSQRWVQPARKAATRQPAPPPCHAVHKRDSDKPWSLGASPEPEPVPPACQRRYEPDISTELRGPAQGKLRGVLNRTTAINDCEVGGLLVGHRTASRFTVFRATQSAGVGSKSGFVYDLETDLKVAGELSEREGFEILGAWHSHSDHVPYPFPSVVDLLSEPDLCSAAAWRSELDAPALFVLMVRDQASRWICLPSVVQASDHAGPDIIAPSKLVS